MPIVGARHGASRPTPEEAHVTEREAQQARLEQQRARWQERYRASGERDADFSTISGEPIPPLVSALDRAEADPAATIGFPGEYPYTRGVHATMYRGRPWTIRQDRKSTRLNSSHVRISYAVFC